MIRMMIYSIIINNAIAISSMATLHLGHAKIIIMYAQLLECNVKQRFKMFV